MQEQAPAKVDRTLNRKARRQKRKKNKPVDSTSRVVRLDESNSKKDQEIYLRLNFLYQLAKSTNQLHAGLSRHYLGQFIEVAEKRVIRINKQVKRQICKKCPAFLTSRRIVRKRNKQVILLNVCPYCQCKKKSLLLTQPTNQATT